MNFGTARGHCAQGKPRIPYVEEIKNKTNFTTKQSNNKFVLLVSVRCRGDQDKDTFGIVGKSEAAFPEERTDRPIIAVKSCRPFFSDQCWIYFRKMFRISSGKCTSMIAGRKIRAILSGSVAPQNSFCKIVKKVIDSPSMEPQRKLSTSEQGNGYIIFCIYCCIGWNCTQSKLEQLR
jgi:hypothetical protein